MPWFCSNNFPFCACKCVLAYNRVNHAKSSISKPFQSTNSLAANSLAVKGKLGTIMQQVWAKLQSDTLDPCGTGTNWRERVNSTMLLLIEPKSFGGVQVAANSTIGTAASAQSQLGASLMYLKNLSEQSGSVGL